MAFIQSLKHASGIAVVALVTLLIGPATAAGATETALSDADAQVLTEFLSENGVDDDVRTRLMAKASSGEVWDSMTDSDPVSVQLTSTAKVDKRISTYADGSILVEQMQKPTASSGGGVTPRSVGSCMSVVGGSGYSSKYDCKATAESGFVTLNAYISYTNVQGGYDYIIEVHSPSRIAVAGTATTPKLKIAQKSESSTSRARAEIETQFTATLGTFSRTYRLGIYVGADSAWTQWITPS